MARIAWNKGLTAAGDDRVKQNGEALRGGSGKAKTPEAEAERRRKISQNGKGRIGGYRENAGRTKKHHISDSFGTIVCLQSSYELRCAEILNDLGIKWQRPNCFWYELEGKRKRYFPDFYLPDYGVYFDTKNDYLAKIDAPKIQAVIEATDIDLRVLTLEQLTKGFISSAVEQSLDKR